MRTELVRIEERPAQVGDYVLAEDRFGRRLYGKIIVADDMYVTIMHDGGVLWMTTRRTKILEEDGT